MSCRHLFVYWLPLKAKRITSTSLFQQRHPGTPCHHQGHHKEHLHLLPERERQSKAGVPFSSPFPLPFLPSQRQGPTETCISFDPSSVQISTVHTSTQFLWPSSRSQGTLSSFYKFIRRGQRDLQPKHRYKHSLQPPSNFGFSLEELSLLSSPLSNFVSMVYDSPSSVATSCFVLFCFASFGQS